MRGARLARAALALALWSAGCQMLIDGEVREVRCAAEGTVGPPACPAGEQCRGGRCAASVLGATCDTDDDCGPGDLCLDPAIAGGGDRRCSRPCCSSGDCDPDTGFLCVPAPGGAGNFCRPAADVGRAVGGPGKAGAACDRDSDCRSGRCAGGRCADTCCADTPCALAGSVCRYGPGPDPDPPGFWCAPPLTDKKPRYTACDANAECASGLCIPLAPGAPRVCSAPCCTSAECGAYSGVLVACAPVQAGAVWVQACSALALSTLPLDVGGACAADAECHGGICLDGRCSDACCSDASCGDPSSFVCRPRENGDAWALRCASK